MPLAQQALNAPIASNFPQSLGPRSIAAPPVSWYQNAEGERSLNGSTTTIRRAADRDAQGFRNFMWISMLMSLAIVFFGMQLMMVGPLKGRLDGIQSRLELADGDMKKLVASRDSVWKTNDLLTSLQSQTRMTDQLKVSLSEIQTLREQITTESRSTAEAIAALDGLLNLQNQLVSSQSTTHQASQEIDAIRQLQEKIVQSSGQTEVASNSLDGIVSLQNRVIAASNGYEDASRSIGNLADLTQKLVSQSQDLQIASRKFDEFVGLKNSIQSASEGMELAQNSVRQLKDVKDLVLSADTDMERVQNNVRTLVAMKDQLGNESLHLDAAQQNLDSLVRLQSALSAQSTNIMAAVQNLEIMDDFQSEVATHIRSLDGLRKTFVEIAMMESTVGRVAQVMQPLTDIGNLRRLSEGEVREAARAILDRRTTRFSQAGELPRSDGSQAGSSQADSVGTAEHQDDLVPLPPEAR
jgi:hypothetical protein